MTTPISILLADDHGFMRSELRNLLDKQVDMKVIGEAGNGPAAVAMARELSPSVVLMDIAMPQIDGIDATRQIIADTPTAKVIALSAHSDHRFFSEALKAGAVGYLPKPLPFEEVTAAIRAVADGKIYFSPRIVGIVIGAYIQGAPPQAPRVCAALSPRERETLQLITAGLATKEVARRLTLSVKTIETHRARMMVKLNIDNVAMLTKYAIREGITSVDA